MVVGHDDVEVDDRPGFKLLENLPVTVGCAVHNRIVVSALQVCVRHARHATTADSEQGLFVCVRKNLGQLRVTTTQPYRYISEAFNDNIAASNKPIAGRTDNASVLEFVLHSIPVCML